MSLKGIAKATLAILERGAYEAPSGEVRTLQPMLDQAVAGSCVYEPGSLDPSAAPGPCTAQVEVREGTTQHWARNRDLLETPYTASVITAPALNAGQHLRRDEHGHAAIEATLRRRAGLVLAVAKAQGHRTLLLGAWGCGVFRNDPSLVADAFGVWLHTEAFGTAFDRVVFGVYDPSRDQATLASFQQRFPSGP